MQASSHLGILLDFIDEYESGDLPADVRLGKFFKSRRYLGSRDRRFIGNGVFSWLRHRLRGETRWRLWTERAGISPPAKDRARHLGSLLALAADGLFPWSRDEVAAAARSVAAAAGGGWVDAIDRSADFLGPDDWPTDPIERLAARRSLPDWIAARLVEQIGEERADALAAGLLEPAPVDLRVNLSLVEREVARAELEKMTDTEVAATPLSPNGLRLATRRDLKQFMKRHPGWIQVQDEGSQLVARLLASLAPESVVDVCAGAGGKTLAVADMLGREGRFHCCDIDASKLAELAARIEPLQLRSITIHAISVDGELPRTLPRSADLIFADAPCTGLGSLRRNPDAKYRYSEEDVRDFAVRQLRILERFASRVKPGGHLVYITCSILPAENEDVAQRFLEGHSEFETVLPPAVERLPEAVVTPRRWVRLDPPTTGTDAFFVATFRRVDEG